MNFNIDRLPQEITKELSYVNGVGYTSIIGASRIFGVSDATLGESFKTSLSENPSKLAKKLMDKGFEPSRFFLTGIPDIALTLIGEYYSMEAGARCTEQARQAYKAFAAVGIREWIKFQVGEHEPLNNNKILETKQAIDIIFGHLERHIDGKLIDSCKLTSYARHCPAFATEAEEAKKLLSATMVVESKPLTPTEIGKLLNPPLRATEVNKLLIEKGLQTQQTRTRKSQKTNLNKVEKYYELTELGKKYGQAQLETCSGHNKTVVVLRWFSSVLDQLQ